MADMCSVQAPKGSSDQNPHDTKTMAFASSFLYFVTLSNPNQSLELHLILQRHPTVVHRTKMRQGLLHILVKNHQ